ncbi:hypothetical protein AUJ77_02925 [Candidatus Nomurabacteria bacterium CG1_02_43_90]|uniref:Uncharacterized protein n=1 Tax=Candidatus Nomurabacteria bacterium CG1_02_43_90 TaxID=1805281 RepID=A0A1J4V7F5_9BACT|nr:MAG: hypothetical protein AUJ77_02925 [Candidatus Nomurabacteria bacterium CG1_02_43_90]
MIILVTSQIASMVVSGIILSYFIGRHLFGPSISKVESMFFWGAVIVITLLSVAVFSVQLWGGENYSYVQLAKKISVITVLISLLPFIAGSLEGKVKGATTSRMIQSYQLQKYEEIKVEIASRVKEKRAYTGEEAIGFIATLYGFGSSLREDGFQEALNLATTAIDAGILDLNLKVDGSRVFSQFDGKSACDQYRDFLPIRDGDKKFEKMNERIRNVMSTTCGYK